MKATKKWVKYKIVNAWGYSEWEWERFDASMTREQITEEINSRNEREHYRGVKLYVVKDSKVPKHVWAREIRNQEAWQESIANDLKEMYARIKAAHGKFDLDATIKEEAERARVAREKRFIAISKGGRK